MLRLTVVDMDFTAYDIALVPVIVALVHVLRMSGLPARFLPLSAIVLGIAAGYLYLEPHDPRQALLSGILLGLSAIGAWSGMKNSMKSD